MLGNDATINTMRMHTISMALLAVVACSGDDGGPVASTADDASGGTAGGSATGGSGGGSGDADTETPTGTSGEGTGSEGSTAALDAGDTAATAADESTGDSGDGSSDETGSPPAFECEDGELPVTVEGAGSYDTIQAAVNAAPLGGVVLVCPGLYEEAVEVPRDVTVRGAGAEHVTVDGGGGEFVFRSTLSDAVHLSYEGLRLVNAEEGIRTFLPNIPVQGSLDVTGVTIENMSVSGIFALAQNSADVGMVVTVTDSLITGVQGDGTGGGIRLHRVTAEIIDTIIENNSAFDGGGLHAEQSDVTVSGGAVRANAAVTGGGGITLDVFSTLTVNDSDWGTGMALENTPTDVHCVSADVTDAGFLGEDASVVCAWDDATCCLP